MALLDIKEVLADGGLDDNVNKLDDAVLPTKRRGSRRAERKEDQAAAQTTM